MKFEATKKEVTTSITVNIVLEGREEVERFRDILISAKQKVLERLSERFARGHGGYRDSELYESMINAILKQVTGENV